MLPSRALYARKFFDVVTKLPGTGVGAKVQRNTWPPESYWTVTAVRPTVDGNHGKAWGIFTWKGAPKNEQPTRVRGTLKQVWRLFEDPSPKVQWQRLPLTATKQPASAEVPASEATVAS